MRTRNHRIQIRLNDAEQAKLENLILKSGLSKEAFVRRCLFDKKIIIRQGYYYPELTRLVSKILNTYLQDLNQISVSSDRLALGQLVVEKTWRALKEME